MVFLSKNKVTVDRYFEALNTPLNNPQKPTSILQFLEMLADI